MPRSRERCSPRAASASGLLAAPQTTRQRSARGERRVDQAAERARREHVELAREQLVGARGELDRRARSRSRRATAPGRSRRRARPRRRASPASGAPTLPRPITPTRRPARSASPSSASSAARIAPSTVRAVSGDGSPPSPSRARAADDVARVLGEQVHVGGRRADVLGGDVGAAERARPRAANAREPRGPAGRRRPSSSITALPPPRSSPAADGLQRHRAREPQRVVERLRQPALVAADAQPAERRPEHGRVDRDRPPAGRCRRRCTSCDALVPPGQRLAPGRREVARVIAPPPSEHWSRSSAPRARKRSTPASLISS